MEHHALHNTKAEHSGPHSVEETRNEFKGSVRIKASYFRSS